MSQFRAYTQQYFSEDGIAPERRDRMIRSIQELENPVTPSVSPTHITNVLINTYLHARRYCRSSRFIKFVRWMTKPKRCGSSIYSVHVMEILQCEMKRGFHFMHPLARRSIVSFNSPRASDNEFEHVRTESNEIALTHTSCRESARMHTRNVVYVLQSMAEPTAFTKILGALCEMCKNNCMWYSMVPLAAIVVITKMYSVHSLKSSSKCRSELNEIFARLSSIACVAQGACGHRCASADRARTIGASIICALSKKTIEFMDRRVVREFVRSMISNENTINSISPFFGNAYGHVANERPRWIIYEPVPESWTLRYPGMHGSEVYGRKVVIESCLVVACGRAPDSLSAEVQSWFSNECDQLSKLVQNGMLWIPWTSVCNILSFFYGLIHYIESLYCRTLSPISTAIQPVREALTPQRCMLQQLAQFTPILKCNLSSYILKPFDLLVQLIKIGEFDEFWLKYKSVRWKWPSMMKAIFDMHYKNIEKIRYLAAIFHMETGLLHVCRALASCSASDRTQETVWKYMGAGCTLRNIMRAGKCETMLRDLY